MLERLLRGCATLVAALTLTAAMPGTSATSADFDTVIADAKALMLTDPARAQASAEVARNIAAKDRGNAEREVRIATAEWLQGEALIRMNQIDRAAPLIDDALIRLDPKRPTKLLGDLMRSRAGVHEFRAEVSAALADYQRAHNIYRDIHEERSQSIALISIGALYQTADDNESALKYYSRAIDIYRADPALLLSIYNNRGTALKELDRLEEADQQFRQAFMVAQSMKSTVLEAQILRNLARVAVERKDFSGAARSIAQGRALINVGEARAQFDAIEAEMLLRRGATNEARERIDESFANVDLTKTDLSAREAHYTAYEIYNALGDEARALAHLKAMKRLDDQVWKLTASTNTALMAARFDSANQEARIARLKADAAARQLAMAKAETRFQQIIFGGITLGATVMVGLLVFNLLQSRRARIRLSASNVALERALAAKTEFLATTSHEIRTPLNGILGMTQVMLADPRLDAASRDRVGIVHDAGLTMRSLVDDILDVAKMETGNLTIEALPFDLKTMLEDVTRMWAEQARAKGLDFRLELDTCPRGIVGDAGRLRQLVYNLLSNAVKFTAAGKVAVRASSGDGRLTLAISDSGIGIPAEKQSEIFESFRQADGGTTRQFGGTGLGLAIVRNIAVAMGGSVSVESVAGAGATFIVDLPLVLADIPEPEPVVTSEGLLIVDRNPIARAMLKAVLEPRAGSVTFAGSCAEAVAYLGRTRVARILIDEAAARADDADPIAAVASVAATGAAPVAVLWAKLDDSARAALEAAGAELVISKPIAGPALASALYGCNTENAVVTRAA